MNLVNKIAQLEQLSHIIAHNLRGPAGNIKMLTEALLSKSTGDGTVAKNMVIEAFTEQEILVLIDESATALLESLATLIEITGIKLNKEIPYNDCDVNAIVDDIISQQQGIIYEKHASIILDLEIPQIRYPKVYLENILYNLISNALKYSSKHAAPEIFVSTRTKNNKIQVIVRDNGIGIDMQKYGDRVFKLNQVFHEGYDSKGIGLYITKTQVESLGGSIDVTSELDEGSEFTVTL